MVKVRQLMPWVIAAFLIYAVVTSPTTSADTVHNIWKIISQGVSNFGNFFHRLLNS